MSPLFKILISLTLLLALVNAYQFQFHWIHGKRVEIAGDNLRIYTINGAILFVHTQRPFAPAYRIVKGGAA